MTVDRQITAASLALWSLLAGGCATPASDVKVPTLSMRAALDRSRSDDSGDQLRPASNTAPEPLAAGPAAGSPQPIVTLPDVRLAWLYEWVDAEGNRHFGSWVAIPVSPSRWVLSDGVTAPLDGTPAAARPRRDPQKEGR